MGNARKWATIAFGKMDGIGNRAIAISPEKIKVAGNTLDKPKGDDIINIDNN